MCEMQQLDHPSGEHAKGRKDESEILVIAVSAIYHTKYDTCTAGEYDRVDKIDFITGLLVPVQYHSICSLMQVLYLLHGWRLVGHNVQLTSL